MFLINKDMSKMTKKEIQDSAWKTLPKKFKDNLIRWHIRTKDSQSWRMKSVIDTLFGEHNITSSIRKFHYLECEKPFPRSLQDKTWENLPEESKEMARTMFHNAVSYGGIPIIDMFFILFDNNIIDK